MHIKNHTIHVNHGAFGGILETENPTASHEMTISFNASLNGGVDGWIDDLIDAIAGLAKQQTLFLTRAEVDEIREEYATAHALANLPEGEGK